MDNFGMTACHPAEKDENGNPRRDLWPPQDGTALPTNENNPIQKLLWMSVTPGIFWLKTISLWLIEATYTAFLIIAFSYQQTGQNLMHVIETKDNQGKPIHKTPVINRDKKNYFDLKWSKTILPLYTFTISYSRRAKGEILYHYFKKQKTHLLMRLLQLDDMYMIMHVKEISQQVLWLNSSMIWPEIKMNILQQTQKEVAPIF